jgi:CBS domain-containing protein
MSPASAQTAPVSATAMHSTTVREAMHPGIMACTATASVAEVAHIMASCRVHSVIVVAAGPDQQPSISGVLSEVDLLRWATGGSTHLPVGAVVSSAAAAVSPGAPVQEAAQLMADREINHLVVLDTHDAPLGIISALDVAGVLARDISAAEPAQEDEP